MKTTQLDNSSFGNFFKFQDKALSYIDRNIKNSQTLSQNDFISSIIHELKSPISAIIGFADLLGDDLKNDITNKINKVSKSVNGSSADNLSENCVSRDGDNKYENEKLDYIKNINEIANDLNDLVNDLLEVNSFSKDGLSVNMEEKIDIHNLVKRSIKLNYDYALRRKIAIKSNLSQNISSINLDAKRIKQILTNLISNSVKYSPERTEITITAKDIFENNGQKYLEIIVSDQGFGMTESQIETAFQKYQTIQNPNSGTVDSFGLGLPNVKQLVELQNGKIEVISEVNKGTDFILKFPYL